jgi:hypothetical protein
VSQTSAFIDTVANFFTIATLDIDLRNDHFPNASGVRARRLSDRFRGAATIG